MPSPPLFSALMADVDALLKGLPKVYNVKHKDSRAITEDEIKSAHSDFALQKSMFSDDESGRGLLTMMAEQGNEQGKDLIRAMTNFDLRLRFYPILGNFTWNGLRTTLEYKGYQITGWPSICPMPPSPSGEDIHKWRRHYCVPMLFAVWYGRLKLVPRSADDRATKSYILYAHDYTSVVPRASNRDRERSLHVETELASSAFISSIAHSQTSDVRAALPNLSSQPPVPSQPSASSRPPAPSQPSAPSQPPTPPHLIRPSQPAPSQPPALHRDPTPDPDVVPGAKPASVSNAPHSAKTSQPSPNQPQQQVTAFRIPVGMVSQRQSTSRPIAEPSEIWPCIECGRVFNSSKDITRHMTLHCPECSELFDTLDALGPHVRTHFAARASTPIQAGNGGLRRKSVVRFQFPSRNAGPQNAHDVIDLTGDDPSPPASRDQADDLNLEPVAAHTGQSPGARKENTTDLSAVVTAAQQAVSTIASPDQSSDRSASRACMPDALTESPAQVEELADFSVVVSVDDHAVISVTQQAASTIPPLNQDSDRSPEHTSPPDILTESPVPVAELTDVSVVVLVHEHDASSNASYDQAADLSLDSIADAPAQLPDSPEDTTQAPVVSVNAELEVTSSASNIQSGDFFNLDVDFIPPRRTRNIKPNKTQFPGVNIRTTTDSPPTAEGGRTRPLRNFKPYDELAKVFAAVSDQPMHIADAVRDLMDKVEVEVDRHRAAGDNLEEVLSTLQEGNEGSLQWVNSRSLVRHFWEMDNEEMEKALEADLARSNEPSKFRRTSRGRGRSSHSAPSLVSAFIAVSPQWPAVPN